MTSAEIPLIQSFQALSITPDAPSEAKANSAGSTSILIQELSREVAGVSDHLYQIEELRHGQNDPARLHQLLSAVTTTVPTLPKRLASIHAEVDASSDQVEQRQLEDLHTEMEDVLAQHRALMAEMKDDEQMSRFNSTAQQALGMIDPLESSLTECLHYVELISSSPVPVPLHSDLPELPSFSQLHKLVDRHVEVRRAYAPSIGKVLKMLEKSIADRATKNGAMLRRYDELSKRWLEVQSRMGQLETRIQILKNNQNGGSSEILASPQPQTEYFTPNRSANSHRSSVSSGASSSQPVVKPATGLGVSALAPTPGLRRKNSFMSATSSSTAKTVERVPSATVQTPANKRVTSVNRSNVPSPTPSASSAASQSRIPVASPAARVSLSGLGPRRSVGAQEAQSTPTRPSASSAYSTMSLPRNAFLAPSMPRSMTQPRPRGPPSSFRTLTPTPSNRPSSRMSMVSYAPSGVAPANLQPFQPSKYDSLDTTVQSIIDEVGFNLFVARVDTAMKKGQRRRDDEEWKGDYVFGAGQRTSSVKLLKLAGKPGKDGPRVKCMVRVQGAWHDLATVLRNRMAEAPETFGSP